MKIKDSSGWFLSVGFLVVVGLAFCVWLSDIVYFKFGAVLFGLLLLVLVYLFNRKMDKEDSVEGVPINKVGIIAIVMPILYGLAGLGIIGKQMESTSTSNLYFWLGIEFGIFLLYVAWKHFIIRARN